MSDLYTGSRANRLDAALHALLTSTPELEAAAVVSFDGLPMASALPVGMDEDRVAAMSAALLSLGERAAQGLGRGDLSQVYVEGEDGTVFLVSAQDTAVLVAVAARGAKIGMMLFEVKRTAAAIAAVLAPEPAAAPTYAASAPAAPTYAAPTYVAPAQAAPTYAAPAQVTHPAPAPAPTGYAEAPQSGPVALTDAVPAQAHAAPVYAPSYAAQDYSVAAVPAPSAPVDTEPVWPAYAPALPADPDSWA